MTADYLWIKCVLHRHITFARTPLRSLSSVCSPYTTNPYSKTLFKKIQPSIDILPVQGLLLKVFYQFAVPVLLILGHKTLKFLKFQPCKLAFTCARTALKSLLSVCSPCSRKKDRRPWLMLHKVTEGKYTWSNMALKQEIEW